MARYTGWRRLSGDTADRPDLLDLGKRLLGELDTQRRLSGVKTLTMERQAPDGSTVRVGFIYEHPFIEVQAASNPPLNARRAIALRMVAYLAVTVGTTTRHYRALVELDYFDAETFEFVASPRRVLWWSFAGIGSPRALYSLVAPYAQPYIADAASSPKVAVFSINNVVGLFDPRAKDMPAIGAITNSLWSYIYGESISVGTETYPALAVLPSGNILAIGYAREATPLIPKLPEILFAVDKTTLQATSGRLLTDVFGTGFDVSQYRDFQTSPTSEHAFVAYSSGLYKLAPDLTVAASLAIPVLGFAFARDGATAFVFRYVEHDSTSTIFSAVDTGTMTVKDSITLPTITAWGGSGIMPRIAVGSDNVYCMTQDVDGPCIEVRRQSDFGFVRRVPLDALVPLTTTISAPNAILGPGEKRIYFDGVVVDGGGGICAIDAKTGELLEAFNATSLKQDTGDPLKGIFASPRTYYLAR